MTKRKSYLTKAPINPQFYEAEIRSRRAREHARMADTIEKRLKEQGFRPEILPKGRINKIVDNTAKTMNWGLNTTDAEKIIEKATKIAGIEIKIASKAKK